MTLPHRSLGATGARVPELCLGTMTFGLQCDEAQSFAILDRAFEAGLSFLDTSNVYPLGGGLDRVGTTEEIIGRWMQQRGVRDRVFVATKCFGRMSADDKNSGGLSRMSIHRAVEGSLRRLQTDVIDLYQSHGYDPHTPIEETMRAYDDLVRAGKVRYVGASNYPAWRLSQALGASERLGLTRYQTIQPRYNLLYREIETELLPLSAAEQVGVLVYNPIAGGMLSGKYKPGDAPQDGTRFTLGNAAGRYQWRYWQDAMLEHSQKIAQAARERDLSPVSVAVAWVLRRPEVTSAIIGASKPEQLDANLAACGLELDEELLKLCDDVFWQLPRRPVIDGYR